MAQLFDIASALQRIAITLQTVVFHLLQGVTLPYSQVFMILDSSDDSSLVHLTMTKRPWELIIEISIVIKNNIVGLPFVQSPSGAIIDGRIQPMGHTLGTSGLDFSLPYC